MTVIGIIPSRYDSSRFTGKPLKNILGKSMIRRVYEQAEQSELKKIIVATDDKRIVDEVLSFNGEVMMTSSEHISGTDRCLEVAQKVANINDIIINIQGDEPFIEPQQINQLIAAFTDKEIGIVTLCKRIEKADTLVDNSKPKVKFDDNKKAISFDRVMNSPFEDGVFYKHIGIYAYRFNILEKVCALKPSSLEIKHKLEQWRWLQNGYDILVLETPFDSFSVDTPEDLKKIIERFGDSN
ncbi:3-deoxy-manno-octulosonate cytidylyltransferase [Flavobacteriales bacterium]|nr:3-deoxy-manno-octulosonate cytidylyltransferase [Flavobacteriales bacterium]